MAIVSVTENRLDRRAEETRDFERKYFRSFLVITDDVKTSSRAILNHTGLPALFAPYITTTESDAGAIVVRRTPAVRDDGLHWDVEIEYSTVPLTDPSEEDPNPTLRPPKITVGSELVQETLRIDNDNDPIINSATERYDPAPMVDVARGFITIERNLPTIDYTTIRDFTNKINSGSYFGFRDGELRITGMVVDGPHFGGTEDKPVTYYRWTVNMSIKESRSYVLSGNTNSTLVPGWDLILLDEGVQELAGGTTNTNQKTIKNADGLDLSRAWPLDGIGNKLAHNYTAAQLRYNKFEIYDRKDFTLLGLI